MAVNSFLRMQLLDLARTLSRKDTLNVEFSFHSYIDTETNTVAVSQFWSDFPLGEQTSGMKSDLYLRTIGSAWFTSSDDIQYFLEITAQLQLPRFAKQLFALGEDIRLEQICKQLRPGTARIFDERRRMYVDYFKKQIRLHILRNEAADTLFSAMYLRLAAITVDVALPEPLSLLLQELQSKLALFSETTSTQEVAVLSVAVINEVSKMIFKDMTASYFSTQVSNGLPKPLSHETNTVQFHEELERPKKLKNDEALELDNQEDVEKQTEKMPTWHQSSSEQMQNMLQFELDEGVRTDLIGDSARESDPGDQALALVQGATRFSKRNEFPNQEELHKKLSELTAEGSGGWGEANRSARAVWMTAEPIESDDVDAYHLIVERIAPFKRKLTRTIQLSLELKKTAARSDLIFGRLNKKLIRMVTDRTPRLFYKKNSPVNRIDAAFVLLVDCSASMFDKMNETKLGITLFHETLRALQIPHAIVGFWEESDHASKIDLPNVFHVVIDFASSLKKNIGPQILQLGPKQDNRDGYAIRVLTRYLQERSEKNKVLLVFSDGQPAATDYDDNGIVDTCQAVLQARRQAIDVVGIYLAKGEVAEEERDILKSIYGRHNVVVPEVEQLTQQLTPILSKLLHKGM